MIGQASSSQQACGGWKAPNRAHPTSVGVDCCGTPINTGIAIILIKHVATIRSDTQAVAANHPLQLWPEDEQQVDCLSRSSPILSALIHVVIQPYSLCGCFSIS